MKFSAFLSCVKVNICVKFQIPGNKGCKVGIFRISPIGSLYSGSWGGGGGGNEFRAFSVSVGLLLRTVSVVFTVSWYHQMQNNYMEGTGSATIKPEAHGHNAHLTLQLWLTKN